MAAEETGDVYKGVPILFPLAAMSEDEGRALRAYLDSLLETRGRGNPDRLCIERGPRMDYSLAYVVAAVSFMDYVNEQVGEDGQKVGPLIIACSSKRDISVMKRSVKKFLAYRKKVATENKDKKYVSHGGFVIPDMLDSCINPTSIKISRYNTCMNSYNKEGSLNDIEECEYYSNFFEYKDDMDIEINNTFYSTKKMNQICGTNKLCPYYSLRYLLDKSYSCNNERFFPADILLCSDEFLKYPTKSYELFEYLGLGSNINKEEILNNNTENGEDIKIEKTDKNNNLDIRSPPTSSNSYLYKRNPLIIFFSYRHSRIYETCVTRNDMDGALKELEHITSLVFMFNNETQPTEQKEVIQQQEEEGEEGKVLDLRESNSLIKEDYDSAYCEEMIKSSKNIKSSLIWSPNEYTNAFYRAGPRFDTPMYFINLMFKNTQQDTNNINKENKENNKEDNKKSKFAITGKDDKNDNTGDRLYPPLGFMPGSIIDIFSFLDFLRTIIEILKTKMKVCEGQKIVPDKPVTSKFSYDRNINSNNGNLNNINNMSNIGIRNSRDNSTSFFLPTGNNTVGSNYYYNVKGGQGKDVSQKYFEDGVTTAEFVESLIDDINCLCIENNITYPFLLDKTNPNQPNITQGLQNDANNIQKNFSAIYTSYNQSKAARIPHLGFLSIARALASIPYRLNSFFYQLWVALKVSGKKRGIKLMQLLDFKFLFNLSEFLATLGLAGMSSYYVYTNKIKMDIVNQTGTNENGEKDKKDDKNAKTEGGNDIQKTNNDNNLTSKNGSNNVKEENSRILFDQNIVTPPSFLLLYSYPPYTIKDKAVKEPKFMGKQMVRLVFNEMRNNLKNSRYKRDTIGLDGDNIRNYTTLSNAPILSLFELVLIGTHHILFDSYSLSTFKEVYSNNRYRMLSFPLKNEELSSKKDALGFPSKRSPTEGKKETKENFIVSDIKLELMNNNNINNENITKSEKLEKEEDNENKEDNEEENNDDDNNDDKENTELKKRRRKDAPNILIVDHGSDQTMITLHPAHLSSQLYTSQESSIFKNLGLLILSVSRSVSSGIIVALPSLNVLRHSIQMWADMGLFDSLTPCLFIRDIYGSTMDEQNTVLKGFINAILMGRGGVLITTADDHIDIPRITALESNTQASIIKQNGDKNDNEIDIIGALIIMGIPYSSRLPAHTAMYLGSMRYRNLMYRTTEATDINKMSFSALDLLISEAADSIATMTGNILNSNPNCKVILADCRFLNTESNKFCVTRKLPYWMKRKIFDETRGVSNESTKKVYDLISEEYKE